jgi:hypothetical protein
MLWMDSDGFCARKWNRDPIAMMIQHNLTIFCLITFRRGVRKEKIFTRNSKKPFTEQSVCFVYLSDDGHLKAKSGTCTRANIYYASAWFLSCDQSRLLSKSSRSKVVESFDWGCIVFQTERRSNCRDGAGSRLDSYSGLGHVYSHGFRPEVYHNGFLDGYRQQRVPKGFNINYWPTNGTSNFPEAVGKCNITNWG